MADERDETGVGLRQRFGHEFGSEAGDHGQHAARRRDGGEPRASTQSRHTRHGSSAGFTQRSADGEHVAEAALVGINGARSKAGADVRPGDHVEIEFGLNHLRRGTDLADHNFAARKIGKDVRRTRRGEGDDGVGAAAEMVFGRESVGTGAGGNINANG